MRSVNLLILALCCSLPSLAAWAKVKEQGFTCASGTTSCAYSFSPTNTGDLVVMKGDIFRNSATVTVSSISDGHSGTWVVDKDEQMGGFEVLIAHICSVSNAVTTITVNYSATQTGGGVVIDEFSGNATSSCFDAVSTQATGTGTTPTTNALTPAGAGELSDAFFLNQTTTNTFVGTSGWTCDNAADVNSNEMANCWNGSIGTGSTAATATNAAITWFGYQALFKPSAGATSSKTPAHGGVF